MHKRKNYWTGKHFRNNVVKINGDRMIIRVQNNLNSHLIGGRFMMAVGIHKLFLYANQALNYITSRDCMEQERLIS